MSQEVHQESGFSLVEMTGALAIIVLMILSLQGTMLSSVHTRETNRRLSARQQQAQDYIERLQNVVFGAPADPAPSATQLANFFDDDLDFGTITLKQIETPAGTPGHWFTTQLDGVETNWRIVVSNDLDGDGSATGFREGRADLLALEVWAEGRLMYRTVRAADFASTVKD